MDLVFTKMHGIGNDFIVIEDLDSSIEFSEEAVQWFCDRHFGVGADGMILVRRATAAGPEAGAEYYMHYINSDGSLAEMCGNGVRCFAKYLADHGLVGDDADEVVVDTLGGPRTVTLTRDEYGETYLVTVNMGAPVLSAADVPTTLVAPDGGPVVNVPLETAQGTFDVTCVSMGNPHCILWVEDVDTAPVHALGALIENHPAFPNRTNVEFAQLAEDGVIRLRVWERGCGETLACGTGACATVVAATLAGKVEHQAIVELPGGELDVEWDEATDIVRMTGTAAEVFTGTIALGEEDENEGDELDSGETGE
jgi:diaminopimelate epimerase